MATKEGTKTTSNSYERVPFQIPLTFNKEIDEQPVYISHNFIGYTVMRGETVMIPRCVKETYEASERERVKAYKYAKSKAIKGDEPALK